MRLKCIKNDNGFLTFGKFYNVKEFDNFHYEIVDDLYCNYIVPINYFEDVYKIRNEKLKDLGI